MTGLPDLPIREILPALLAALAAGSSAVLQAPPGAGKTTLVPLALLDQPWLAGGRIVMLEPRRLAARAAARRMAALLGEGVGETVGYRVRLDNRVGPRTRIEVVTDGIFTRMIQDDPALEGIGAILFDEFHERRLETDLGLAFALDAQANLRPSLRLIAMSATLDAAPVAALLGDAPILTAAGRAFPVALRYLAAPPAGGLAGAVADAVEAALREPGGILVFLPGGAEIRRVERLLAERRLPPGTEILPLQGELGQAAQDRALAPAAPGTRKIVLATSIAETSLTIDGVRQVVDAGLARSGVYDPRTGMTRLETSRVTQAAAEQRAGRAGRVAPGICWRLWPEAGHKALVPRPLPEIAQADLAPLALELAAWGIADPAGLRLIDPPAPAAFAAARRLLQSLAALDEAGRITAHGKRMAGLGLPPRLGHMVLAGAARGEGMLAVAIAAVLSERDPGALRETDLRPRLERLAGPGREDGTERVRQVARRLARQAGIRWGAIAPAGAGAVLALAYPDRIAQHRAGAGRFLLSGGQGAFLPERDPLAGEALLAVAELDGQAPDSRIWLAAPLTAAELELALGPALTWAEAIWYEPATRSVQSRRRRRLGALVLAEGPLAVPDPAAIGAALLDGVRREGLGVLPWTAEAAAFRARAAFLARQDGTTGGWPALDDESLRATLADWLGPTLAGRRSLGELGGLDLARLLRDRVAPGRLAELEARAPSHVTVPSGSRLAIDYAGDRPALSVKLQEMFGLAETPSIDRGRVRLVLRLLSPARRPIQVTSDLAGFWAGSYRAVRADLRGRYPRHPWPEDPLAALPTARAKPRGR